MSEIIVYDHLGAKAILRLTQKVWSGSFIADNVRHTNVVKGTVKLAVAGLLNSAIVDHVRPVSDTGNRPDHSKSIQAATTKRRLDKQEQQRLRKEFLEQVKEKNKWKQKASG